MFAPFNERYTSKYCCFMYKRTNKLPQPSPSKLFTLTLTATMWLRNYISLQKTGKSAMISLSPQH